MALGAVSVLIYTQVFARTGVGEVFAGLGLGLLPVVGTALVQRGTIGPAAWAAGVPAFLMTFNLLLLNEFPDEKADRAGGRLNLVLLLGRSRAALVYVAAAVAARRCRSWRRSPRVAPAARADRLPAVLVCRAGGALGGFPAGRAGAHSSHGRQRDLEPGDQPLLAAGLGLAAYLGW